jgi:hypothetical protein
MKHMKRHLLVLIGVVLGLVPAIGCGPTDREQLSQAEEKAKTFLDTLQGDDGRSAYGLLSNKYRERLPDEDRDKKVFQVKVLKGELIRSFKIDSSSAVLSPSKVQATFKGTLNENWIDRPRGSFTMILKKEDGDWEVDLFTVK